MVHLRSGAIWDSVPGEVPGSGVPVAAVGATDISGHSWYHREQQTEEQGQQGIPIQ